MFSLNSLEYSILIYILTKGQIKQKADCRAIDSPKKQTNDFFFHDSFDVKFQVLPDCKAKKPNWFVWFLGESTAHLPVCLRFLHVDNFDFKIF